jgi:lysophospholipase L1-like esterase
VTSLAIRYNRRMDVINRGMNGYNSRWGLAALPLILEEIMGPSFAEAGGCLANEESTKNSEVECFTNDNGQASSPDTQALIKYPQYAFLIGYGANDSCLASEGAAHSRHHVSLEEYTSNLKKMIQLIQSWNCKTTDRNHAAVALLTPPPCDTEKQKQSRNNENVTRLYADACKRTASDMRVPVVDLWNGMQLPIVFKDGKQSSTTSFRVNEQWKIDYLSDGLHLTPMGNYRLYELIVEVLDGSLEGDDGKLGMGLAVTALPRSYPDHSMIDAIDPERSFLVSV